MDIFAVVLAAGRGTRMKSLLADKSKVSFEILGVPLVQHVLNSLKPLKIATTVVVVGFGGETTTKIVEKQAMVVWQKEQKGTGHAVMQASSILEKKEGCTIVLCGDTPLLRTSTLEKFIKEHIESKNSLTIMSAKVPNPHGYGRIVRKSDGSVQRICEQADASKEIDAIDEVNTGVCIFDNILLFNYLAKLKPNNAQGEYYLTDLIKMFVDNNLRVGVSLMDDYHEMLGINDRKQLAEALSIMKREINNQLMLSGVTIVDPENTYVGPYVRIGQDSLLMPGCYVVGNTSIGRFNEIGPNTFLNNMEIGDSNKIICSHLIDSKIGNENVIGPYARMRGHVDIKNHVKAGNFVELKGVIVHDSAKMAHLSYLGDAEIGERTNVGCGTIIANYDGVNKLKSKIGNDVFVGSGTTIISPVVIEDEAFIAAGSTINRDVKKNDMAIARARQENKPGYAKILRQKAIEKSKK